MFRIIPRDPTFFTIFSEIADNLTSAARALVDLFDHYQNTAAKTAEIKRIEHVGDELTHSILTKLNQTFIPPFDREDIYRLTSSLDDVLDFTYSACVRLVMYKITSAPPAASQLAEIVVKQADQLSQAVARLEKRHDHALECCLG